MEFVVNGLTFTSKFDSGNLAKVEKVEDVVQDSNVSASAAKVISGDESKPDYEVNIWTSPDSAGTLHENKNRSWFYFGVRGGQSGKLLRMNIMNMNRQGRLYMQGHCSVFRCLPGKPKWERMKDRPTFENGDCNMTLSFNYRFTESKLPVTVYFAFTFPWSYADCQEKLAELDEKYRSCSGSTAASAKSSIYYKRELLCYSLDRQRVDLITISDCHGLTDVEEPHFDEKLFPNRNERRCKWITGKKVYFVSSRVHPGETPSSFVFNGFLDFILREDDPRAVQLRRQYVFKLIPMLNPDGVSRGHYRSDSRGLNLNRFYLDPSFELHPTIYAAKTLLVFHHVNNRIRVPSGDGFPASTSTFWVPLRLNNCTTAMEDQHALPDRVATAEPLPSISTRRSSRVDTALTDAEQSFTLSSHVGEDDVLVEREGESFINERADGNIAAPFCTTSSSYQLPATTSQTGAVLNDCYLNRLGKKRDSVASCDIASGGECHELDDEHPDNEDFEDEKLGNEGSDDDADSMTLSENVYSPHLSDPCLRNISPGNSGIAFYVDLHAHASKRGCFMYGNYLENDDEQAQNVLFARLMAINSAHFDFDACNFTERNMYSVDRKEGLSKEGSGRVALYKALGIIHCYTLECNYNSGRMLNSLPPAFGDAGRATPPPLAGLPPKYTPVQYEEVGRAMAVSALDMNETNPWSRVHLSDFTCVQSLREALRRQIQSSRAIVSRSTLTKPSRAILKGTSGITMIPRVAVLATRQNATQDVSFQGKTAGSQAMGLQRKATVSQPARKLSITGGRKDLGPVKDVHRGAVAQAVDRRRQASLSEAPTGSQSSGIATPSGSRASVPVFAASPRVQLTSSDKLGTQYSVGPKHFGVHGAEADLSTLPKVNESRNLNRMLLHSRSAEFVGMKRYDVTSLDGPGCRRSTSGTTRSISSARSKLRNSLPLTRSFINTNLSGIDQTLLTAPTCSSLSGPAAGTHSSLPVSLLTLGYSSSMISDDFQLLNLNSSNMNINRERVPYSLGTDAASLGSIGATQSSPQSVFNMRGMPAAEAIHRLKLIPIASPGDDKILQSLNKVNPVSSTRDVPGKKTSNFSTLTIQSKSRSYPKTRNESSALSASGTSCLAPSQDLNSPQCAQPQLASLARTQNTPERLVTQSSVAKGSFPVRKSKANGSKLAHSRLAAKGNSPSNLAECKVAESFTNGATAADPVNWTGSKKTAVLQDSFQAGNKMSLTNVSSVQLSLASDIDSVQQTSPKNTKLRKRRRNTVAKKQQMKRKSDEADSTHCVAIDDAPSTSTSTTSCI